MSDTTRPIARGRIGDAKEDLENTVDPEKRKFTYRGRKPQDIEKEK